MARLEGGRRTVVVGYGTDALYAHTSRQPKHQPAVLARAVTRRPMGRPALVGCGWCAGLHTWMARLERLEMTRFKEMMLVKPRTC
jgi:hypothetical protein